MGGAMSYWTTAWAGSLILIGGVTLGVFLTVLGNLRVCLRYGIDTGASTKAQFGTLGAVFTIFFVWFTVFISNANIVVVQSGITARVGNLAGLWDEGSITALRIVFALVVLVIIYFITVRGSETIRASAVWIALMVSILAVILLVTVLVKYGIHDLNAAKPVASTGNKQVDWALAAEFAIVTGFGCWSYAGGMFRMGKSAGHAMYASLLGLGFMICIASLPSLYAGLVTGDPDPSGALTEVLGLWFGLLAVVFVFLANIGTGVVGAYVAGVALKQIGWLRTKPSWRVLTFIVLLPSFVLVCFPGWFVAHLPMMYFITGLFPAQFVAVQLVDYFAFRKGHLHLKSVYDSSPGSKYYFWRGINPAAFVAVAIGSIVYWIFLLDPISYAPQSALFKWTTASIPSFLVSGVLYWTLTRLVVIPLGKGGYERYEREVGAALAMGDEAE